MVRALDRAEVPHVGQKVAGRDHTSIVSGVADAGDEVAARIVGFLRAPPQRDPVAVPPPPARRPKAK